MSRANFVILAAGLGTRMKSRLPKVLHPVCGKPILQWVIDAIDPLDPARVVVVDNASGALENWGSDSIRIAIQQEQLGTGDALKAALSELDDRYPVVVLPGDVPLVETAQLQEAIEAHLEADAAASVITAELEDPTGYGRIVRTSDGSIDRIVETKNPRDANEFVLAINEINTGIYVFSPKQLSTALAELTPENAQNEYYLTDVIAHYRGSGALVNGLLAPDSTPFLGVNDRVDLFTVSEEARWRINFDHMQAGVTFQDPTSTYIDVNVSIAPDVSIGANCQILGTTKIGEGAKIGSFTTLVDSVIGPGVLVRQSYVDNAQVAEGATIGPFAYLRPKAEVATGAKVGSFVEVKNSHIAEGAKVPHLSYIGDCDVGVGANVGAGTITANYDGRKKHRTSIGERARIGIHTSLVAPVNVGSDCFTGAGSVITDDVPDRALGVARSRQRNITDYADRINGHQANEPTEQERDKS